MRFYCIFSALDIMDQRSTFFSVSVPACLNAEVKILPSTARMRGIYDKETFFLYALSVFPEQEENVETP